MVAQDIKERLYGAIPTIERLKTTCKVASISVGVVHENEVVFAESVGYRDVKRELPAEPTTKYMTASVSKTFTTAALGILVHEGKMKWKDKINDHLKDFNPQRDSRVPDEPDFIDLLRHSSGLANPVVSWLGPKGRVILNEKDVMKLVSQTSTGAEWDDIAKAYRRPWVYSNLNYGVAAKAVEKISGQPYASFVKERLLQPLGMDSTSLSLEDDPADENVAYPHFQLSDGSFTSLKLHWTSENLTSVLGAVGVQSSVRDLLTWCIAIMDDEGLEEGKNSHSSSGHLGCNPVKEMRTIRKGYWTRPDLDKDDETCDAAYCLGWFRDMMPSSQVGWGSGNSDPPSNFIIGNKSPKRLVIKHTGLGVGLTASMLTFPDTRSAVVALSNGYNGCDAADFAAQHLTQELFDLKPRVDLDDRATQEHERRRHIFHNKIMLDWLENRNVQYPEQPHKQYLGHYTGLAITLSIVRRSKSGKLSLVFNDKNHNDPVPLEYYNKDAYSFMPTTRDRWLSEGWLDWDYYKVGIIEFYRGENNAVKGLFWQWEEQTEPTQFPKAFVPPNPDLLPSAARGSSTSLATSSSPSPVRSSLSSVALARSSSHSTDPSSLSSTAELEDSDQQEKKDSWQVGYGMWM